MNFSFFVASLIVFFVQAIFPPIAKAAPPSQLQFEENLYSLKELTGIYVVLEYVTKSSEKSHVSIKPNLEGEIKKRLENAGLKLLTKEEVASTPGNPQLDIFPNYPAHLANADKGPEAETDVAIRNLSPTAPHCCYTSIWGSFSQSASITRSSGETYRLSTWGNGSNTDSCDGLGDWMSDATLKIIDNFISDYKKAKDLKKKTLATSGPAYQAAASVVRPTEGKTEAVQQQYVQVKDISDTKGMTCNTALLVYAQFFQKNLVTVSPDKTALLDKLASHMLACRNFRYRIQTSADSKGSSEANEILSARRALALHTFFIEKGVSEDQFEMRFFGHNKDAKKSDEDVAITPIAQ